MIINEQKEKLRALANKMKNAKEYFDNLIYMEFVELPDIARKLLNQYGKDILEILDGEDD